MSEYDSKSGGRNGRRLSDIWQETMIDPDD